MEDSRKFKAAILFEQNQPLVIEEICFKSSLDIGQVLVKLHTSGICGSQIGEIRGVKGKDNYLPHLLGHEGCATVLEVGPGVTNVKPNDLVVLHWRPGKGIQSATPEYFLDNKRINAGWVTTFNSKAIVSENRCTKIPNDTDHALATMFGCAITTAFGVVENNANLKMGESVVVYGAGGIGLNIIQASSLKSAYPIIAVDLFENRLDLASKMGATHIINASNKNVDVKKEIKKILENSQLDCFIDNTGIPAIIELGYEIVNSNGKVVLVGVPAIGRNINIYSLQLHFGKKLLGSHGGESMPEVHIKRYLKLFDNKLCSINSLISSYYSLEDINKALDAMISGETAGRVIIKL